MLASQKSEQELINSNDIAEDKTPNKNIQRTNCVIEKAIEFMNAGYDEMRRTTKNLEKEKLDQRNYINELEKKVSGLQLNSRSSTIKIRNVPHTDSETVSDLTSVVIQTCNAVQAQVKSTDLRDVYRLSSRQAMQYEHLTKACHYPKN